MGMLDAPGRAQPILGYVRELEGKVRFYRGIQTKWKAASFALGFGCGFALSGLLWLFLR
jgi:hypothetical protein